MTMNHDHTATTKPGLAAHPAREGSHFVPRAEPHSLPAGGWLRDIAMGEDWRTTTIVQRHRDRASSPI